MNIFLKIEYKEKIIFFTALGVIVVSFLLVYFGVGTEKYFWGGKDSAEYDLIARNLLAGHGMSLRDAPPYLPTAARMPGYPLLLALSKFLVGNNSLVLLGQMIIFAAIALFTFRIAKIIFINEGVAMAAALFMIFEVWNVYISLALLSDISATGFMLFSIYFLHRFIESAAVKDFSIGLIFISAASFIRPHHLLVTLLYSFVLLYFIFFRRTVGFKRFITFILVFFMIVGLPFGLWTWRNYKTFGVMALVTAPGVTQFFNIAPVVKGLGEGKPSGAALEELMTEFRSKYQSNPAILRSNISSSKNIEGVLLAEDFTYIAWQKARTREIFLKYPKEYAKVLIGSAVEFLTGAKWAEPLLQYGLTIPSEVRSPSLKQIVVSGKFGLLPNAFYERFTCGKVCLINFSLVAIGRLFWTITSITATLGFIFYLQRTAKFQLRLYAILIWGTILNVFIVTVVFKGLAFDPRYRIPSAPYLIMFSVYGIWIIKNMVIERLAKFRS